MPYRILILPGVERIPLATLQKLEEFVRKEEEEKGTDPAAQQLHTCMALADRMITNDGTLEDLHRRLEEFL